MISMISRLNAPAGDLRLPRCVSDGNPAGGVRWTVNGKMRMPKSIQRMPFDPLTVQVLNIPKVLRKLWLRIGMDRNRSIVRGTAYQVKTNWAPRMP